MQARFFIDTLLTAALPQGSLYAVGGRVRDEVEGQFETAPIATKDLDYVVPGCRSTGCSPPYSLLAASTSWALPFPS